MAFNFGAETPPPPAPPKVEDNGYAVGQENGYSGVRVRIKSLKHPKKDNTQEEAPRELFDGPPVESPAPAAPVSATPVSVVPVSATPSPATPVSVAPVAATPSPVVPVSATPALVAPVAPTPALVVPASVAESFAPVDRMAPGQTEEVASALPDGRSPDKPAKSKRGRKSLKQVGAEADLIEVPGDDILFSKQYYTMRAVAEMFRVNQSLLRFWETEFDILQPRKNKKGDRYFRPIDIKNLHLIYHLLRQRKYTIEGAKEFLKNNKKAEERFEAIQRLQQLKAFLLEWKAQL